MEEVAAKRSEMVRMTGGRGGDWRLIPHVSQLPHVILAKARTST